MKQQKTVESRVLEILKECPMSRYDDMLLILHYYTFTTRMCEAGVNIKVIQDALGHSDISTTLNIYADVTKEMKAEEFKGLDSYFKV